MSEIKIPLIDDFRNRLFNADYELLLDVDFGYFKSGIYGISKELGVYDCLGQDSLSAEEIAKKLGCNAKAMKLLLDALVGLKVISKKGDGYCANQTSKMARYYGYSWLGVKYNPHWRRFIEILKGKKLKPYGLEGHEWGSLQEQMHFVMETLCGEFQGTLKLLEKERVFERIKSFVDIGGGHGLYSIGFCKTYPRLKGTVFDLPKTLEVTKMFLKAYNMEKKIDLIPGDITKDELNGRYDMAFISNLALRADEASFVTRKVYDALNEGGLLVIKDMSPIKDWSEAFYALAHEIEVLIEVGDIEEFSLTPTMQEYIDIMKDVGFREAKVLGWVIKGWNSMVMGIK